ncbi:MAG: hypothetical protein JNM33_17470, partial [Rubrivivax sp.]|nr:hypothetical protein [Rubrivivax sp.]
MQLEASPAAGSGHPPGPGSASLDLALVGNCAISALVDRQARIVWCC